MSCPNSARKRSVTIAFRVTSQQAEEIDRMAALSGLAKQDYLTLRALDDKVSVVPSSRTVKALREGVKSMARELARIADATELDGPLLEELHGLVSLMGALARYGEEDFDAVERILSLKRE